ncbi:MAG: hypothetical protein KC431_28675, partial [Myxococcales bacterium]|nr:hypothetical protein [Myxococcales bacterium]
MAEPPPHIERLADAHALPQGTTRTAHVAVRSLRHGIDRNGDGYYDLVVGDASARMPAKIWGDSRAYDEVARGGVSEGKPVKLMFGVGSYRDAIQLTINRIRVLGEDDEWVPESIWGDGWELVEGLHCKTLVFDIETVPDIDLATVPASVAGAVARAAERGGGPDNPDAAAKVMGLSPYFGKVVSLA